MSGLGDAFAGIIADGSVVLAFGVAALAGLVSFASPCCLPLVPGYLGYIAGLAGSDVPAGGRPEEVGTSRPGASGDASAAEGGVRTATRAPGRRRMLAGSLLFVAGFSLVFVSFGALFGGLGRLLLEWSPVLTRVAGVVTIVMGLAFMGALPWLQRERRLHHRPTGGLAAAPVLGVVFGLGWTPCLGPTLAAVNTLAYTEASAGRGALLGVAYCLGLGIPFVAIALGARGAVRMSGWARRHARTVTRVGGGLLILIGLLLLTGLWDYLITWLRAWIATTGLGETFL